MKQNNILSDRVPQERWLAAQEWERNHWVNAQRARARFGKNYIWRRTAICCISHSHAFLKSNIVLNTPGDRQDAA